MHSLGKTLLALALLHSVIQGQINSAKFSPQQVATNRLYLILCVFICFPPQTHLGIPIYAPTSNAEEAEWFFEDLQDLLELTAKKDVLFLIGDWNAKVGSQETPGVTGKLGLGIQNEAGQRLIEFCQENTLVITNTLFQQHKRRLYTWTSADGQH